MTAALWHFQVQHSQVGIESTRSTLTLRNGLFHRVTAPFSDLHSSRVDGQQLTLARAETLNRRPVDSTVELLRCVIGEVADPQGFTHASPEGPTRHPHGDTPFVERRLALLEGKRRSCRSPHALENWPPCFPA